MILISRLTKEHENHISIVNKESNGVLKYKQDQTGMFTKEYFIKK